MDINEKAVLFLDTVASQGINQFTEKRLKVLLIAILKIDRTQFGTYKDYFIETEMLRMIGNGVYEINHDMRLAMKQNNLAFLKTENRTEQVKKDTKEILEKITNAEVIK